MDKATNFASMFCKCNIQQVGKYDIKVKGRIDEQVKGGKIYYIAAAPADHRATYTGSGLPFSNQIQAFDNTPNAGTVDIGMDNSFEIDLMTPNSYMVGLGSITVPPTLYIQYINSMNEPKTVTVKVSDGIPYRTLTYPTVPRPRSDASFYDSQFDLQVRSQEQILIEAGYPRINTMPNNHWGTKPPL